MVPAGYGFLVAEANQAQVTFESLRGRVRRSADVTAQVGNLTPTALAKRGRRLVMGNLGKVPFIDGSSAVFTLSLRGKITQMHSGLTTVVALSYDHHGRLYALETSVGKPVEPPFLFRSTGRVVRIGRDGSLTPIVEELNFPTGMTPGPRGDLYVSVCGYGCPAGAGAVVRVDLGR